MKPQTVRGMNDVLPEATVTWQYVEGLVRDVLQSYGYREIRLPLLEQTELFRRSIGEVTDIVEKEMYTFLDRNGESLTLRPEGTAGMARAGITNGLLYNQRQKLWTSGPMFRYEKPQKGRYRQFYQIDVEAMGYEGPDVDAELIIMSARIWERLGLSRLHLEINTLGTPESRQDYRAALVAYFEGVREQLDEDSLRRLEQNPLRILDSKNPDLKGVIQAAPVMLDYLDDESKAHFAELCDILDAAGVKYIVNSRLVRGLDYYSRTVFEWITDALGAQGAVCSGGRYDGLVEKLGGKSTPAIGWAMGVERLVSLFEACGGKAPELNPDVYVVAVGDTALRAGFELVEAVRDAAPQLKIELNLGGGSFKSQLKRADKSGAAFAAILGDDEVAKKEVGLKPLRSDMNQLSIPFDELAATLVSQLQQVG
jgi:histidyl-tRNA synthetase